MNKKLKFDFLPPLALQTHLTSPNLGRQKKFFPLFPLFFSALVVSLSPPPDLEIFSGNIFHSSSSTTVVVSPTTTCLIMQIESKVRITFFFSFSKFLLMTFLYFLWEKSCQENQRPKLYCNSISIHFSSLYNLYGNSSTVLLRVLIRIHGDQPYSLLN